jgi:sugar phosphate isomerase/epimerase
MNGNNNTGLLLDCYHWYTAHASLADLAFLDPKEIIYVHVNDAVKGRGPDEQIDNEREMVGATGVIGIQGFVAALKKIGYDGPVTVEPFNKAVREMSTDDAVRFTSESLDKVL